MSDGNRLVPGCYSEKEIEKDSRIAKLEADRARKAEAISDLVDRAERAEAELAVAIELVTMARQTFDADGNGTRFLGEIRDDVLKDVKRLAKRSTP